MILQQPHPKKIKEKKNHLSKILVIVVMLVSNLHFG